MCRVHEFGEGLCASKGAIMDVATGIAYCGTVVAFLMCFAIGTFMVEWLIAGN